MFSGLTNLFFGSSSTDVTTTEDKTESQNKLETSVTEDDWEFVEDSDSCPGSPFARRPVPGGRGKRKRTRTLTRSTSEPMTTSSSEEKASDCDDNLGPRIIASYLENGSDSEAVLSDVSSLPELIAHPSMSESWLMTPPPCFTAGGRSPARQPSPNPMENLLIEHPSMSVYGPRGRPSSTGLDSVESSSDTEVADSTTETPTNSRVMSHPHSAGRSRVITAKQQLIEQKRIRKSIQTAKNKNDAKKLSKSYVSRSNMVAHVQSGKAMRRQHFMQLRNSGAVNDRKSQ